MTTNGDTPAFPCPADRECSGLTLREWYAGQALASFLSSGHSLGFAVELAVKAADALLAALEASAPEEGA